MPAPRQTKYYSKIRLWSTSRGGDLIQPYCSSILFKNVGTVTAYIWAQGSGPWALAPNEEMPSINQMHPEIVDETEYRVEFSSAAGIQQVNAIIVETFSRPLPDNGALKNCQPL